MLPTDLSKLDPKFLKELEEDFRFKKIHTPCHSNDDSLSQAGRAYEQNIRNLLSVGYQFEDLPNVIQDKENKLWLELDGVYKLTSSQYTSNDFDFDYIMGNTSKGFTFGKDPQYISKIGQVILVVEAKSNPKIEDFKAFWYDRFPKVKTFLMKNELETKDCKEFYYILFFVYNGHKSFEFENEIAKIGVQINKSLENFKETLSLKVVHVLQDQASKLCSNLIIARDQKKDKIIIQKDEVIKQVIIQKDEVIIQKDEVIKQVIIQKDEVIKQVQEEARQLGIIESNLDEDISPEVILAKLHKKGYTTTKEQLDSMIVLLKERNKYKL